MVIMQGCITTTAWIRDELDGSTKVYKMPVEIVWNTIPIVIKELELLMVFENKKEGYVLAENKMSMLSHGERIAIIVEKVDEVNTKVTVRSKRVFTSDVAATNWEAPILSKMDEVFGQVRPAS